MRVTLKDVSKACGVSAQTVSRILNSDKAHLYQEKTRELVQKAAKDLGYFPNVSAQATRTGRSGSIGLLLGSKINDFGISGRFLVHIQRCLQDFNMNSIFGVVDLSLDTPQDLPKVFHQQAMDGLLLHFNGAIPPFVLEAVQRQALPYFILNQNHSHNAVYADEVGGAYNITQRLIALGHRRIAYMDMNQCRSNSVQHHCSVGDREKGYLLAMQETGLKPLCCIPETKVQLKDVKSELIKILQAKNRPTACIAYSMGFTGENLILAASELGLQIPRDLSFVTFNGGQESNFGCEFDTVTIPHMEMIQTGVTQLMDMISGKPKIRHSIHLETQYIAGKSVAPIA